MKRKGKGPRASELLSQALARQIRKNPAYSLRAASRALKISPSFLSDVLKGKKKIPLHRLPEIVRVFDMDESSQKLLRRAILLEALQNQKGSEFLVDELLERGFEPAESPISTRVEGTLSEFSVLEPWYRLAILDMITCDNFRYDPQWIARRLGIRPEEAEDAFRRLKDAGMIQQQGDRWIKVANKLRFPTTRSHPSIRGYHKRMIEKALKLLLHETDDAAFKRRLITSVSFAANPDQLQKARERLMEALYEVADILTEGECTQVYQLNAQLFSLTQDD